MIKTLKLFILKYGYVASLILVCFAYFILYDWNRNIPSNSGGNAGLAEFQLAISVMVIDGFAIGLLIISKIMLLTGIYSYYLKKKLFLSSLGFILLGVSLLFLIHGIKVFGNLGPPTF